jgi:hypothetical protein
MFMSLSREARVELAQLLRELQAEFDRALREYGDEPILSDDFRKKRVDQWVERLEDPKTM